MKYFIGSVCAIIIQFYSFTTQSQDTNSAKYLPLKVGNIWLYSGSTYQFQPACSRSYMLRVIIDDMQIFNNKTYFRFIHAIKYNPGGFGDCSYLYLLDGYYRIDSTNGRLYRYSQGTNCSYSQNEILFDSLSAKVKDTSFFCTPSNRKVLQDTVSKFLFNLNWPSKHFEGGTFFEYNFHGYYAKGIGLYEFKEGGISGHSNSILQGAVIDGVLYGDTSYTLVGINQISSEIPGNFQLKQNYPNPFNPTTQISFDIPKASFVEIIIYDASGKEIEKLVSDELTAGSYSADWSASAYPSGVYFYTITAGEFRETKKMILLK